MATLPPKKTETLLQRLEKAQIQQKIESYSRESYKWIMGEAKKLAGATLSTRLMKEEKKKAIKGDPKTIHIGSLVMYWYDAKHKDTLPYWDAFPVGFVIGAEGDRFQILNLHYLPPQQRSILLDKLLTIANNSRADDTTKLRLSYNLVKSASKFKLLKPCYHEYLFTHLRSKVVKIQPKDWEYVVFLPLQKFHGASNSKVWGDSVLS